MKKDTPVVLAAATYANRYDAVNDFESVMSAKRDGEFDHIAAAVLTKDPSGGLQVERHDSTAKHLAWGGALTGAALLVAAPVAAPVIIAGGTGAAASAGLGGGASWVGAAAGTGALAGHFWHNIPKDKVREMGDLLESGESGLLIVAVNKNATDITPLLRNAAKVVVDDSTKGDLEGLYDTAVQEATAAA
jgi:uncharacterized membrane protein